MYINSHDYPSQSFTLDMLHALMLRVALNVDLLHLDYEELEGEGQNQNWRLLADAELRDMERSLEEAIECLAVHHEAIQFERQRRAKREQVPPK